MQLRLAHKSTYRRHTNWLIYDIYTKKQTDQHDQTLPMDCSQPITTDLHRKSAAFASLNTFFSITTKLLFRCLAVTDLCVGLITQPLLTVTLLTSFNNDEYVEDIQVISSMVLCGISLLTSTAISVDRLLALSLGLRYRYVVTLRRVRALIISFWFLVGALVGCLFINFYISVIVYVVFMLISLLISAISYAKIYFRLRHQLLHVQSHVHQRQQLPPSGVVPTALNVARYKKTVSAITWVQLGLIACYSPFWLL